MTRARLRKGLNGPEGLVIALIAQASKDALSTNCRQATDALSYFGGKWYQHHVTSLGLLPWYVPEAFEHGPTLGRMINIVLETRTTREYYEQNKDYQLY